MNRSKKEFLYYLEEKIDFKKNYKRISREEKPEFADTKHFYKKSNKKYTLIFASCLCLFMLSLFFAHSILTTTPSAPKTLETPMGRLANFKTKKELNNFIKSLKSLNDNSAIDTGTMPSTPEVEDYSKTNTQDKNVDEGDIVKTDGEYIYFLSYDGFKIVSAENGILSLQYEEKYENYMPIEMYIYNKTAIMIGGTYSDYPMITGEVAFDTMDCGLWSSYSMTDIRFYDISNIKAPKLEQQIIVDGSYMTSRMVENNFYYFIQSTLYTVAENDIVLPTISDSIAETAKEIDVQNIYYLNDTIVYYNSLLIIGKVNINNYSDKMYKAYLTSASDVYVSPNNLYITFCIQGYYSSVDLNNTQQTYICKISLNHFTYLGDALIDGRVKDRYSLDEYNNYLRIVTTMDSGFSQKNGLSYTNLYILNGTMEQVGYIGDIAVGENVYSVRFNGITGTIVTFLRIDPLFKLDLSNPYMPTISQGLKEEGVSYYIHYIEGTNYSIGVGRDTRLENDVVRWDGLKVTLYDNSGEEAVAVNTITIGDYWATAEILYNPKALLYMQNRNVFAFAVEQWNYSSYSVTPSQQGLYVFGFESGRLEQRAVLTNFTQGYQYNNWYDYYDNYYSNIIRGLTIGNFIYTISNKYICSYSLDNFALVQSLQIAEYASFKNLY